jgi:type VI secretion system protein ImpF
MNTPLRNKRLSPPLMFAFRAAHEEKDARKELDLRDEHGERVIAPRKKTGRTPISESGLRQQVLQDLEALLNCTTFDSSTNLDGFDEVRKSILNFGCPDIAHRTIDEVGLGDLRGELETALMRYEPRLLRESIEVRRDTSVDRAELRIRFTVNADLFCNPANVPVEFFADVECDTGKIVVSRL